MLRYIDRNVSIDGNIVFTIFIRIFHLTQSVWIVKKAKRKYCFYSKNVMEYCIVNQKEGKRFHLVLSSDQDRCGGHIGFARCRVNKIYGRDWSRLPTKQPAACKQLPLTTSAVNYLRTYCHHRLMVAPYKSVHKNLKQNLP